MASNAIDGPTMASNAIGRGDWDRDPVTHKGRERLKKTEQIKQGGKVNVTTGIFWPTRRGATREPPGKHLWQEKREICEKKREEPAGHRVCNQPNCKEATNRIARSNQPNCKERCNQPN